MILKSKEVKALRDSINQLIIARIDDSWKGGGNPDYIPYIEEKLKRKKLALRRKLLALDAIILGGKNVHI